MNFGDAIQALKEGKHVARAGWNGKSMWIALVEIHGFEPAVGDDWHEDAAMAAMEDTYIDRCIVLRTAGRTYQPGWNASTPDMLAEDWAIVTHPARRTR